VNLYLISQDEEVGYDTFDSAVVCAATSAQAQKIHPNGNDRWPDKNSGSADCWCAEPSSVNVKLIGRAKKGRVAGVIVASFNAG